ncbi:MAG: acetate kinase [Candidatus Margulisbacteria bacterium]|nr:acetate kinase [Candidatus Margulisiibacteriota bacterium]
MLILVLNCGSSSVKYALYDWDKNKLITKGNLERIGQEGGYSSHKEAIENMLLGLAEGEEKVIESIKDINAVGHRVVHGGDKFNKSVLITTEVLNVIRDVAALAPLHNPPNIVGIESAMEILPGVPQVAVFDTAFHQTLPPEAYMYPVPYEWYAKYGIRRYGFHGSSHLYVSKRAAKFLGIASKDADLITLHIGNGVSFTAIEGGKSVDTSMGFTPLEGAMMGTRSGDIDPAIVGYMSEKLSLSAADTIQILNKNSGHLGITGKYTDRRDVVAAMAEGDKRAQLSMDMEIYRINKYIGAYMARLNKVEAIVFTAGVGENNAYIREKAMESLENIGVKLDKEKNKIVNSKYGEAEISAIDSQVKVLVIPTDEEAVLVEDVAAILQGTYDFHWNYKYRFES